jgi:hypothetical protein
MGTDKVVFVEVWPEVTSPEVMEVIAVFFPTKVVVQNVGRRDPEGVLLGARMRNRVSPRFFRVFWPEMT